MSFPDPSIPAPALALYELSYRGVNFGGIAPNTPYQLKDVTGGLDLPAIQSGDVQRPLDGGEFMGVDVSQGRDIPLDLTVIADLVSLDHARQTLGAAFQAAGNTEYPLFIQLASGPYACMARPRKFNFPLDINWVLAKAVPVAAQLHSTDSLWYASPSKTASVGLPASLSGGGLTVPAPVPWSLGGGGVGGILDVWNLGTAPMFPVLVVTGPCINPAIANLSIAGAPTLRFGITLNAGDTLTIDTQFQTVTLVAAGSSLGSPRDNTELPGSTWWTLLPANGPDGIAAANTIEFTTADGSFVPATLTVNSADAYPVI